MTGIRFGRGIAVLVVVAVIAATFAGGGVGDTHDGFTIEQDGECHLVDPIRSDDTTAAAFYDYRAPNTEPTGYTYSSHGTVDYQQDDTSILILYEGPEGTSLVIVHDKLYENSRFDGTKGGSASFEVTGLPANGSWVVEDDDYDGQTDEFIHGETESELHWIWATGRTDGAVFTGIENDSTITIDPRFNDDARLDSDFSLENGTIDEWHVIDARDGGFDRVSLPSLSEPVTISRDGCAQGSLEADLTANNEQPEVGTAVTFDASGTESQRPIQQYRWDVTGDGDIDERTTDPTFEHEFDDPGEYTVSVTAVDVTNGTDTASVTITVMDEEPLDAVASVAPNQPVVNESVTFDAGDSSGTIDEYQWSFGDNHTATGETVERSYEAPGEYEVGLVVTNRSGATATANTTVVVSDPGPVAELVAPEEVTAGDAFTLDAGGSTTAADDATYDWYHDESHLGTTTEPTTNLTIDSTGATTVAVVVTDAENETDRAEEEVVVTAPFEPTIESNETEPIVGTTVELVASGIEANVSSYEWDLGDGTTATGETVTHQYDEPGDYEIEVIITTTSGTAASATTSITVAASPEDDDGSGDESDDDGSSGGDSADDGSSSESNSGESSSGSVGGGSAGGGHSSGGSSSAGGGSSSGSTTGSSVTTGSTTVDAMVNEIDDGAIQITASDVDRGEVVETDLNVSETARVSRLTVEIEEDTEEFVATLQQPAAEDLSGSIPSIHSTAELRTNASIGTVTYEFSLEEGTLDRAGMNATDVTAYRYDEEWTTDDVEVERTDDDLEWTVESSGSEPIGIATTEPALVVSEIETETETAIVGHPFEVTVTVDNHGPEAGTASFPILVDDEEWTAVTLSVPGDGSAHRTVDVTPEEAGDLRIRIDETETTSATVLETAEITVQVQEGTAESSIVSLSIDENVIEPGDEVRIDGVVENDGTVADTYRVQLRVAGSTAAVENVTVGPGERTTVTFTQRFESEGSFEIAMDDHRAEVTVGAADTHEDEGTASEEEPDEETIPGFGAVVALIAVLAFAFGIRRYR